MKKYFILSIISFVISLETGLCGINSADIENIFSNTSGQDTIKERQILYNGKVWNNRYHGVDGDQFLFSEFFLSGTVSINGKKFSDVRIKYDILSDEIITPVNDDDILQLNKEMVDSFTISFEDKVYRFTNIRNDVLKDIFGYTNVLYHGNMSLYVKYKKAISNSEGPKGNGYFIQTYKIYFLKENVLHQINGVSDIFSDSKVDKDQIRNFIKKNKLRISRKNPESFVPVFKYYDSISK